MQLSFILSTNCLATTGPCAGNSDSDGDGQSNLTEYLAGTDPRAGMSFFKISAVTRTGNYFVIRFPTVTNKSYRVECCDDLTATNCWTESVTNNVPGTGSDVEVADPRCRTTATAPLPRPVAAVESVV